MLNAADVGGQNALRFELREIAELSVAQLLGQIRLQYRIGAGGAAAHVAFIARRRDIESQRPQVRFHAAAQLEAVLQGAGRVKGNARGAAASPGP